MALTNKLSAIGDSIRAKTGKTELLTLDEMPTEINSISGAAEPVIEALNITTNGTYTASDGVDGYSPVTVNVPQDGAPSEYDLAFTEDINYLFNNGNWSFMIEKYGNLISFKNIISSKNAFSHFSKQIDLSVFTIPLNNANISSMFSMSNKITKLPSVSGTVQRNFNSLFSGCMNLPSNEINKFFRNLTITDGDNNYATSQMVQQCVSARDLTETLDWLDISLNSYTGTQNGIIYYNGFFYFCVNLDAVTNLFIYRGNIARTSNVFNNTFYFCFRLSDIMFKTDGGTPYSVSWKGQVIDLRDNVGFVDESYYNYITNYNSGITADKEVTDDATYQSLKNDPDWFTTNVAYSRYNHDSAVRTINSLPDTSAYLSTAGGTNTIKFKGTSGSATDGGAINTLTPEEIAVATAKGWTVTLV